MIIAVSGWLISWPLEDASCPIDVERFPCDSSALRLMQSFRGLHQLSGPLHETPWLDR